MIMIIAIISTAIILNFSTNDIARRDKYFILVSFLLLFIISALRAETIGTDTSNYLRGFEIIKHSSFDTMINFIRWEKGYVILNKIVSIFTSNGQGILIVSSFIVLFSMCTFIKRHSNNTFMSILLYINLYYYFASFNMIRQSIAMGLIVLSYAFIKERNFRKFLLLVLLASTFHQIALVFIPVYFLYNVKLNTKNTLLIIIGFIILIFGFDYIFNVGLLLFPEYKIYVGTDFFKESGILTTLIAASIVVFGAIIKLTHKRNDEFDFLFIIMIFGLLTSMYSQNISLFNRLAYYFTIFSILFIPKAIGMVKNKKMRVIYYFPIIMVTSAYFLIRLFEGWQRVTPYRFFFMK